LAIKNGRFVILTFLLGSVALRIQSAEEFQVLSCPILPANMSKSVQKYRIAIVSKFFNILCWGQIRSARRPVHADFLSSHAFLMGAEHELALTFLKNVRCAVKIMWSQRQHLLF